MSKIKLFRVELFDSRNTAMLTDYTDDLAGARVHAKWHSIHGKYPKAILKYKDSFEGYENGELVAWSFPSGLTN